VLTLMIQFGHDVAEGAVSVGIYENISPLSRGISQSHLMMDLQECCARFEFSALLWLTF
jgi:hypothetical protein